MSEMGHKRPNHRGPKSTFVRFGPIADKRGCGRFVRFVPIADSRAAKKVAEVRRQHSYRSQPVSPATAPFGLWIAAEPSTPCLCPMAHTGSYRIKGATCHSKLEALL